MKHKILSLTALLLPALMIAQTCVTSSRNPWEWPGHNNWFVGNKSGANNITGKMIDFQAGFSVSTTGQAAFDKGTPVYEGVTTASNDKGELIVFSNGRWAWDANSNRVSTDLKEGNEGATNIVGSSAQGIMSVRHPLNPNRYFLVTVGDVIGGAKPSVSYNIFDETGTEIQGATSLGVNATEGITATLHENGVDVWVIVHEYGSPRINAFLLLCDGTFKAPVVSAIGPSVVNDEGRGGLAMSWDGKKMAMNYPGQAANAGRQLMLYDFDKLTGKFSNRMDVAPTNKVMGGYDVTFSKDNSMVYVAGHSAFTGALCSFDISSNDAATIRSTYVDDVCGLTSFPYHHSIEWGADGHLYLNGYDGFFRWTGSGNATKLSGGIGKMTGQGMNTMYIPPAEEPDIVEVGPFCDTSAAVNLETYWLCSGVNAEDTVTGPVPSEYKGKGILYPGEGIFDPKVAGKGLHQIIFTKCAVDDTIWIEVTECVKCIDTLKTITPTLCPGDDLSLKTLIDTANGVGVWSIDSFPTTASVDASIDDSTLDTLFDATDLNTKPGVYKVMYAVTKDALTCKDSIYIKVNKLPEVSVNDSTICEGDPDALFTATVDSAVAKYTWGDNGSGSTLQTASGNTVGIYTVEIEDNNGCIGRDTGELFINKLPVVTVNDSTICEGDPDALFTATVDSAVAKYTWGDNGAGSTVQTASGNTAGIYTVEIEDVNGCLGRDTGELFINKLPVVTVNNDTICDGDPAATFAASVDSAVSVYAWIDNGTGDQSTTTGTTAGDYTVNITDVNGCLGTATGTLKVNALPVVTVNDSAICEGAPVGATFTATVDSVPLTIVWLDKGVGQTGPTATGTAEGVYKATVIDENGCAGSGQGSLILNKLPVVSVNSEEICDGDPAVTFTATVDSAVSTHSWTNNGTGSDPTTTGNTAGDYTVSIVDVNGCEGTATGVLTVHDLPLLSVDGGNVCPGTPFTLTPVASTNNTPLTYLWSTTETATTIQAGPGTYDLTVTDAKGCQASDDATVVEDPNLTVTIPGPIEICQGEDTVLTSQFKAADGYSFAWTNGTTPTGDVTESITVSASGTYGLGVNKGSCQGATTVNVTVHALPTVTVSSPERCEGDPVATTITATSATAVDYLWSEQGIGALPYTTGIIAGNYTVEVTDANNCKASGTGVLTVNQRPTVTVNNETICQGDPAVTFTATSATATSHLWSEEGTGTDATTTGTAAGNYTVVVTDAKGCKDTATGTLTVNSIPDVSVNNAQMCDGTTAQTFTATSATATSYLWSENGSGTSSSVTGSTAGNYTVIVTDANTCSNTATGVLTVNALPTVTVNDEFMCENETAATFTAVSPTATSYTWTGPAGVTGSNPTLDADAQGNYQLVILDANGCTATASAKLDVGLNPVLTLTPQTLCFGLPMTLSDRGSDVGFSYSWRSVAGIEVSTTSSHSPTTSNDFSVTKTNDVTGCNVTETVTATFIDIPTLEVIPLNPSVPNDADTLYICEGETESINANMIAQSVTWTGLSQTTETIMITQEGNYVATASNGNCSVKDSIYLKVAQYPVSTLDKTIGLQPICFEQLDSNIVLVANQSSTDTYFWNNAETTNAIEITGEGTYSVVISADDGSGLRTCDIEDQVTLKEFCPYGLFVPNTFTPDGDGINDIFYAYGHHLEGFEFYVFDRWGLKVFESNDLDKGWDGTYMGNPVQIDLYVWKIKFTVENEAGALEDKFKVGHVNVIR